MDRFLTSRVWMYVIGALWAFRPALAVQAPQYFQNDSFTSHLLPHGSCQQEEEFGLGCGHCPKCFDLWYGYCYEKKRPYRRNYLGGPRCGRCSHGHAGACQHGGGPLTHPVNSMGHPLSKTRSGETEVIKAISPAPRETKPVEVPVTPEVTASESAEQEQAPLAEINPQSTLETAISPDVSSNDEPLADEPAPETDADNIVAEDSPAIPLIAPEPEIELPVNDIPETEPEASDALEPSEVLESSDAPDPSDAFETETETEGDPKAIPPHAEIEELEEKGDDVSESAFPPLPKLKSTAKLPAMPISVSKRATIPRSKHAEGRVKTKTKGTSRLIEHLKFVAE